MAENLPKFMADTKPQIKESQRIINKRNNLEITARYMIFKLMKSKTN